MAMTSDIRTLRQGLNVNQGTSHVADDYDEDLEREILLTGQSHLQPTPTISLHAPIGSYGDAVLQWTPKFATNIALRHRIVDEATRPRVGERQRTQRYLRKGINNDGEEFEDGKPCNLTKRAMIDNDRFQQQQATAKSFHKLCSLAVSSGDSVTAKQALKALSTLESNPSSQFNLEHDGDEDIDVQSNCLCSSFENPLFSVAAAHAKVALLGLSLAEKGNGKVRVVNTSIPEAAVHRNSVVATGKDVTATFDADDDHPASLSQSTAAMQYQMARREVDRRVRKRQWTLVLVGTVIAIFAAFNILKNPQVKALDHVWIFPIILLLCSCLGIKAVRQRDEEAKLLVQDLFILASSSNHGLAASQSIEV